LEDLKAIAPAMVQALQRKKSEEALLEAYEKVQVQSEELQVSNEELRVQSDELHEANKLLHANENKFRTLAENSPDLIAVSIDKIAVYTLIQLLQNFILNLPLQNFMVGLWTNVSIKLITNR
jgi:hypothetical protein